MFEAPSDGAVVRFAGLRATWNTMHARDQGHLRWVVSFYGGSEGNLNDNPETGLVSDRGAAGIMWLAAGNRQFGVHRHTMTECYVILSGQVESIEPGREQRAGPLDCLLMPPGAAHAVRAVGEEDVVLLWCHDANELIGRSEYFDEDDERWQPSENGTRLIRWEELQPDSSAPGAGVGETMRSSRTWVVNDRFAVGSTTILPGSAHVPHAHPFAEHYVVITGRAAVLGDDAGRILDAKDYVGFAAGQRHALRAVGVEPLHVLWIQEEPGGEATYESGG